MKYLCLTVLTTLSTFLHAQILEEFNNFTETGSYANGSFIGENEIVWEYGYCKGTQSLNSVGSHAICIGNQDDAFLRAYITDTCLGISFYFEQEYSTPSNANILINGRPIHTLLTSQPDSTMHWGIDTVILPPFTFSIEQNSSSGQLTIDNVLFQISNQQQEAPEVPAFQYGDLILSEIMFDPYPAVEEGFCEFIELYNNSDSAIFIDELTVLVNDNSFSVENITINEMSYIALGEMKCAENMIVPNNFPALPNTGGTIQLWFKDILLHSVTYSPKMHDDIIKAEGGWSLELASVDDFCVEDGNWHSSKALKGATPGIANSISNNSIFELHVKEFYMPTDSTLSIKFSHSIVFSSIHFESDLEIDSVQLENINSCIIISFSQKPVIGEIYSILISLNSCNSYLLNEEIQFGITEPAQPNDILITEILYDEKYSNTQFLEIQNTSSKIIDLNDYVLIKVIDDEIADFSLLSEKHFMLMPTQVIAVCVDKNALSSHYETVFQNLLESNSQIVFPNSESTLQIRYKNGTFIEEIHYYNELHSSLLEETKGCSLSRNRNNSFSSEGEEVGFATPGYLRMQELVPDEKTVEVTRKFYPQLNEKAEINILLPNEEALAYVYIYDLMGNAVKVLAEQYFFRNSCTLYWDGMNQNERPANIGNYVVKVIIQKKNGRLLSKKRVCAIM